MLHSHGCSSAHQKQVQQVRIAAGNCLMVDRSTSQYGRSLRQCRTDLFDSLLTAPQTEDADETSQQHYQNIQGGNKQVRVPHLQGVHHVLVHVKPAKHVNSSVII